MLNHNAAFYHLEIINSFQIKEKQENKVCITPDSVSKSNNVCTED